MEAALKSAYLNLPEKPKWLDDIRKVTELGTGECYEDFRGLKPGGKYLQLVSDKVNLHRGKAVKLPMDIPLVIGGLDDTVYWGRPDLLKCWEDLYLPQRMDMVVLGMIESYPCLAPGLQLVILAGKDGSVFAYEEEMLHKIASDLEELFCKGPVFPGTEIYEYGRGFRPKNNEEYMAALKEAGLEKISQDTRNFISRNASEMKKLVDDLDFL
ncbi:uncharacterized protein LOC125463579 [Stegostoma tigrinum]|uniref:uncharacterized protein LOC125463579 n=1 Tax=Stegostoma tigrinum TaxID=3053191 RepID=UPI00202AFACF|nr:uncharacterized protein LOC125463579 [Stegostoma tigrinum]